MKTDPPDSHENAYGNARRILADYKKTEIGRTLIVVAEYKTDGSQGKK